MFLFQVKYVKPATQVSSSRVSSVSDCQNFTVAQCFCLYDIRCNVLVESYNYDWTYDYLYTSL
jgi:hypothetical protein